MTAGTVVINFFFSCSVVDKIRSKEENLCIRRWNTSHRSWRVNYQKTLFWSNQHLSSKGIKYTRNSLKIALFGYFGVQYSTECSEIASEKKALILSKRLKKLSFLRVGSGFFNIFVKKIYKDEIRFYCCIQ